MVLMSNDDDNEVEDMCFLTGTTTWHETHIMQNLSVKMSFVPCYNNMYFFVTMFSISPCVWGKHKFQPHVWVTSQKTLLSRGFKSYH
jgi:hypothetical protein